ncbi:MSF1-like family protein [Prunus dulcis]|uniref:MSF1-like family protein n=1 Tax=Prunus dulcis TaxID=3755 RepID=A0A4Y1RJ78_PRUDU|nr:MSF1-like family protein [Prunus dulcis]
MKKLVILEDPLMLFCKLYYCIASDAHAIQIYAYEVTNKVMVKAYTQEYTYKHPWERVTSASWKKFADPENKRTLSHILEVDTLNHKLDPSTGKLYTTRAITVHSPGPWFVRKIVRQDVCHCVESTVVDAKTRSMQLTTNNISLEKFIEVEEKIRYDPHPENPDGWTICRQETSIRIKPLSALASMAEKVEQRCAERFVQNSAKGREVMERICKYLEAESKGLARS